MEDEDDIEEEISRYIKDDDGEEYIENNDEEDYDYEDEDLEETDNEEVYSPFSNFF